MSLIPRHIIGELDLTEWPFAIIQGASDYGTPTNVAEVVDSMLQDGEVVSSTRTSNRVMSHSVFIEEADMQALAEAEATLIAECDKQRNTWSIDPGDGYGAVTVFDIFRVQVAYVHDDNWEWAGYRRYDLTIPALPFGRSESEVVDAALTSGAVPSTVTVSDGASATGWTSPYGAVTTSGGRLMLPSTARADGVVDGLYVATHTAEGSLAMSATDFSATPYVSVDVSFGVAYQSVVPPVQAWADGSLLTLVASSWVSGALRCTFLCADSSVTSLRFVVVSKSQSLASSPSVETRIDNVQRSNQAPNASSSGRQSMRTVKVGGSARTAASLSVEHPSAGLGDVLVYTCPALGSGYQPDLRRWRTSGGTVTADATTVSGSVEAGAGAVVFNVPAAGLPRGSYVLMVRAKLTTAGAAPSFAWSVATKIGSATFSSQSGIASTSMTAAYSIASLGLVTLPPTDVAAGSAATVEISVDPSVSVDLDEAWIFYLGDDAALTQIACGAGTPALGTVHNRLWLDTASLDRFEPSVWVGTQADRSDAFHAGNTAAAWGVHSFAPPSMQAFVVTTGAANPSIPLRRFRRFHTHAYDEAL